MVRTTLITAVLAVAALTLGACGSGDAGTESSTVSSSSSAAESAATDTSSEASSEAGTEAASESETVAAGSLDAQSAAWFTAACDGLTPMGEMLATVLGVGMQMAMATDSGAGEGASAADLQSQLVAALDSAGASLTSTKDTLAALPAPTIDKGSEIAAAFSHFLETAGPQLSDVAKEVAEAPATDTAALSAALAKIQTLGSQDLDGADVLKEVDPATQAAIQELPACKSMQDSMGGLIGGTGAPTSTEG